MSEQTTYSLYLDNDLNRVFTDAVPALAATELRIVADRLLDGDIGPIERLDRGREVVSAAASASSRASEPS